MSFHERTGERDLLYSQWHRPRSIDELVGFRWAGLLHCVDIDFNEYCSFCYEPLALIEIQRSAAPPKPAKAMAMLAHRAAVPAFSVSYEPSPDGRDIRRFRRQQLVPIRSGVVDQTPLEYARWLCELRSRHFPSCPRCVDQSMAWLIAA